MSAEPHRAVVTSRPTARRMGAVVSLALGVVLTVTYVVSLVAGTLPDDGTEWMVTTLVLGFVATAGLEVSRPAADRVSRVVHGVAVVGVPVVLGGACLVALLR